MSHTPGMSPVAGRPNPARAAGGLRGVLAGIGGFVSRWSGRAFAALMVTGLGILIGQQYMAPNKRVLPVIAAAMIAGITWRLDLVTSIGATILLLPFPKGTVFGTTNTALVLLIAIVWLVNSSLGRAPAPRRTPVDGALVGLVIMYICSFYNVHDAAVMSTAISNTEIFLASVVFYYLIAANITTTRALERLHVFQMICALSIFLLALYELKHPGAYLFGGVVRFAGSTGAGGAEEIQHNNIRIGSAFGDYELLSEFCVMTMLLTVFLWARAATVARRALLSAFLILNVFVLFATVTRGALFSLAAGLATLLWTTRRRLKFVPFVIGLAVFIGVFGGMNFYVANFTSSGDMFGRLSKTHFENGVPDSRVGAWGDAFQRAMNHPWIGHGPAYILSVQEGMMWPHNVYLFYASTIGFVGLAFYLLILAGLFKATRPSVDSLRHHDYARSFQVVAQAQFVAFVVNEMKIDYLRNNIYTTVVWAMFSMWVATYFVARRNQAEELSARIAPAR